MKQDGVIRKARNGMTQVMDGAIQATLGETQIMDGKAQLMKMLQVSQALKDGVHQMKTGLKGRILEEEMEERNLQNHLM